MSLGIDLPNLRRAADFSGRALSQIQDALREDVPPEDECLDIIVFGSLARYEATGSSDLDYYYSANPTRESCRIRVLRCIGLTGGPPHTPRR